MTLVTGRVSHHTPPFDEVPKGVTVVNVFPPIPLRQFDWCAYRDPEGLCGWGSTVREAIDDLLDLECLFDLEHLE